MLVTLNQRLKAGTKGTKRNSYISTLKVKTMDPRRTCTAGGKKLDPREGGGEGLLMALGP